MCWCGALLDSLAFIRQTDATTAYETVSGSFAGPLFCVSRVVLAVEEWQLHILPTRAWNRDDLALHAPFRLTYLTWQSIIWCRARHDPGG